MHIYIYIIYIIIVTVCTFKEVCVAFVCKVQCPYPQKTHGIPAPIDFCDSNFERNISSQSKTLRKGGFYPPVIKRGNGKTTIHR